MSDSDSKFDAAEATATIVAAYVGSNHIAASELPGLIKTVRGSLDSLSGAVAAPAEPQAPAVPLRRLVTADIVFCAECGAGFKSLKRHLGAEHGLTPQEYRAKWGLKRDFPMVAPSYSARRSEVAKHLGLGRKAAPPPPPAKAAKAKATPEKAAQIAAKAVAKPRSKVGKAAATSAGSAGVDGRPEPMFDTK